MATNTSLENYALSGITVGLSLTLGVGVIMLIPHVLTTKVQTNQVVPTNSPQVVQTLKGDKQQGVDDKLNDVNVKQPAKSEKLPGGHPASAGPTPTEDAPPIIMSQQERAAKIMNAKLATERPLVSNHFGGRKGYFHENLVVNYYRDQCAGEGIKVQPGGAPPCTESVHKTQYDLNNGVSV